MDRIAVLNRKIRGTSELPHTMPPARSTVSSTKKNQEKKARKRATTKSPIVVDTDIKRDRTPCSSHVEESGSSSNTENTAQGRS